MSIFELMEMHGHEELVFCYDRTTGLRAIVAIHDTTLGPALGGTRMWNYEDEGEALKDALRLSRSMTYQAAVADCDTGGGKAVLWGDPARDKSEAYFRAFGRFVEGLNGRFITYGDLGTDERDLRYVMRETDQIAPFVSHGAAMTDGAKITAYGVVCGMRACCKMVFGVSSLKGRRVAIQGVGEVGAHLARYLYDEGARLVLTDIVYDAMKRVQDDVPDVKIVRPDAILGCECDVLSPCALGGVINDITIEQLKCKIIAGAAYHVIESDLIGDLLHKRGILYAPDFVISAGELFQSAYKMTPVSQEEGLKRAEEIYDVMVRVLDRSIREEIPPYRAARKMAVERIEQMGRVRTILTHPPDLGL
ncbi:MAG: Glu/Leu/Phe/Val dehydrogenase dimerization domain-containing protein [Candidatus Eisenbacteria bacterium]